MSGAWLRGILEIPGVVKVQGGLRCTWDVAWAVAALTKQPAPAVPADGPFPGLERYRELGFPEKLWAIQKEDVLFAALHSWCVIAESMRSGKTPIAIAAAELLSARKILVVCPRYARLGWGDAIQDWSGEAALLLCGRGARKVKQRCLPCRGRGMDAAGEACGTCSGRGYPVLEVAALTPARTMSTAGAINWGQIGKWTCPRHTVLADAQPGKKLYCGRCYAVLHEAVEAARWVVINPELLVRQHMDLGGGKIGARADLAGWVPELLQHTFDFCIVDEFHLFRGIGDSDINRREEKRNARLLELLGRNRVPRVIGLTGTPFYGFTRDMYWLLQIASGGLWGPTTSRYPERKFLRRYCEGRAIKGRGYESRGRSIYAETELMRRLHGGRWNPEATAGTAVAESTPRRVPMDGVMIQRSREEFFKDAPPIVWEVLRIELEDPVVVPALAGRKADTIDQRIMALNDAKREALMDRLLAPLAEGLKIVVYCFHVASARKTFLAIERAMQSPSVRTRMRQVNAKAWLSTGPRPGDEALDSDQSSRWARDGDARYKIAEAYREHVGAAVFVATTDSMGGMLSLAGGTWVCFLDLHRSPGALAQAAMRPWTPTCRLTVTSVVARETVDDHIEAEVLPKVETLARMGKDKGAADQLAAFGADDARTVEAVYDRLTRHLRPLDGGVSAEEK